MVTGDPGDPPILVIHDPQSLYVTANVWESDISRVRIGRPAEVWVDAYRLHVLGRGKPYRGRVKRINPTTAAEMSGLPPERFFTRREQKVPVKIAIEDADPGFRAGMLAEVLILVDDGAIAEEQ
jgi:membrane fusion protein (multidrug efflux system)